MTTAPSALSSHYTLDVTTPEGHYPVYVGSGILGQMPAFLTKHRLNGSVIIITNQTIAPLYGQALAKSLNAKMITVPDGETHKTLDTVRDVYSELAAYGTDRGTVVIGLGGGVIGDMAGFIAATYLRGLPYIQVPLSLLSMVDASVGGKVGVNLPEGKNLVGAFKQPEFVLTDTDVLNTLPLEERRAGLAEVIKHGFIKNDPMLFDPKAFSNLTPEFVARAIQVKIELVIRDPYEHGDRAFLNLGHTFAHAIESVSGYSWRHGEAVAVGLVGAARLSTLFELCGPEIPEQIEAIVKAAGLPTSYKDFDPVVLRKAMNTDKKRQAGKVRFVLLNAPGDLTLHDDVPDGLVLQALASLRQGRP